MLRFKWRLYYTLYENSMLVGKSISVFHPCCCCPLFAVELILNHELELAAIQAIHEQLDDNEDGNVDLSESSEVCVVHYSIATPISVVAMECRDITMHASSLFLRIPHSYLHCTCTLSYFWNRKPSADFIPL